MTNSRTKNSALILMTSGIRQALTLILTFVSRTIFIRVLGAEYLGLNGLFSNVLSILALSELGIGSAILFYLYRPIADNDEKRILVLMNFYKRCYRIVGLIILGLGLFLTPFLPFLVNFEQPIDINLYVVYILFLFNSASSYFLFAYKQAFVTANQEQYRIEKVTIIFVIIGCVVDAVVLFVLKNYYFYLLSKLLLTLLKNYVAAIVIDKAYPFLRCKDKTNISKEEFKRIMKDIFSVSLFRVGSTLFNATDNIIISIILGTVVVGYYSNYFLIISEITVIVGLVTKSFTAGIGNVVAKESVEKQYEIYKQLDFIVFVFSLFCTTCLFQLFNSFINLWVGKENPSYAISQLCVLFLSINFYFDSTTQIANTFRESAGFFKTGRSLQLIGGIVNIIFSIIFGKMWGLSGIFAATIVGKGLVTIIPFFFLISKNVFKLPGYKLLVRYLLNFLLLGISLLVTWFAGSYFHMKDLTCFVVECIISAFVPVVIVLTFCSWTPEFKMLVKRIGFLKGEKNEAINKYVL